MKKKMGLLLMLMLSFVLCMNSYAAEVQNHKTKYDPLNMAFEERVQWIEENIEPTYTWRPKVQGRSEWLYSNTNTTTVGNDIYNVGYVTTQVKFKINDSQTAVTDWASEQYRTDFYVPCIIDTNYYYRWMVQNSNIKLIYETWYTETSGAYLVEHWYNLRADGYCDFREITTHYEDSVIEDL